MANTKKCKHLMKRRVLINVDGKDRVYMQCVSCTELNQIK